VRAGGRAALALCALAATLLAASGARAAPASIAFYTGDRLPLEALSFYDEVVLEPGKVSNEDVAAVSQRGRLPLARVVPDGKAAAPRLAELEKKGFVGFVFDGRRSEHTFAAEEWLLEARRRAPQARLYFWGGLDRVNAVAAAVSGYVLDGVFTAGAARDGGDHPPEVLDDLEGVRRLAALVEIKARYRFPFIVVERVLSGQREQARGLARTLVERGLVPWVIVGGASLGVGTKEWVPRRILALYDGEEEPDVAATVVHRMIAVPLEYLGYVVDYHDVHNGMPTGDLSARYAGIVSWFSDDDMAQPRAYEGFLVEQMRKGLRIAMLGRPGFIPSSEMLSRMALSESARRITLPVTLNHAGAMIGFEARPIPLGRDLPMWQTRTGEVDVELRDAVGARLHPVMTGSWGGLALDPYAVDRGLEGRLRWVVNPFTFLTRALDLEPIPAPDVTTENGRRLLYIHIDGDAFASVAEMPGKYMSGEIIRREFLERYPLPTTVSIIEGEISPAGAFPELSAKLEGIAKQIFRLPNVEIASHSFGHPFDWQAAAQGLAKSTDSSDPVAGIVGGRPIPNYKYSASREVWGSLQYINQRLAPPDKQARVMLWSGAALPALDAMREVAANKLVNMNGGACELPRDAPALAQIPPLGRHVGPYLQVYAQAQNENVYTNEWRGPFYGFRDVVRMFRFTESPRRLKPINIYYHFYSGTKSAGITALHEVYQYAMGEETMPVVVSQMAAKIEDFYKVTFARHLDGTWELRGLGNLRTVRLDKRLGWPDMDDSSGVVGVEDQPQGRYVSLSGASAATLALAQKKPTQPHLVYANAPIQSWLRQGGRVRFRLKGHVPVDMAVGGCSGGGGAAGARVRIDAGRRVVQLRFAGSDTREVTLQCR
jgi:polysaccharide biosynthesis protein PelA